MNRLIVFFAALSFALISTTRADVIIKLQARQASAATTRPDSANVNCSILAIPGHKFAAKFTQGDQVIDASGSLKTKSTGVYQVTINFVLQDHGLQTITTSLEVKTGQAVELAGLPGGPSITMTLNDSPADGT